MQLGKQITDALEAVRLARLVAGDLQSFCELTFVMVLAHFNRARTPFRRLVFSRIARRFFAAARGEPFEVSLKNGEQKASVLLPNGNETEFWSIRSVITEVLVNRVYRPDRSMPIRMVVDAGANFGLASIVLHAELPDATFLCYEPSSEIYPLLVENLQRNGISFRALQVALTDHDGTVRFLSGRSSMERSIAEGGESLPTEEVRCAALGNELARLGIESVDLLKVDVEGEEVRLLEGLGERLGSVRQIVAETHGPELEREVAERLLSAGFEVSQAGGHTTAVRRMNV